MRISTSESMPAWTIELDDLNCPACDPRRPVSVSIELEVIHLALVDETLIECIVAARAQCASSTSPLAHGRFTSEREEIQNFESQAVAHRPRRTFRHVI